MLARDEKASQPSQNGTQGDNDPPTGNAHLVTIAERIVYAIADTGCSVVYGGHGAAIAPLVNAVVKHPKVKWVCARNEHDAATMAAAHAKLTGQLGCVIATSGPGATNLTTGLMESAQDRVPVLAITGMKPSSQIGYAEFQDTNQAQLFSGAGLIWSKTVTSAGAVSPLLRDAVATALTQRTCSHLAIPVDIQAALTPTPLKVFCAADPSSRIRPPSIDSDLLNDTAHTLIGKPEEAHPPKVLIAVGLRGVYCRETEHTVACKAEMSSTLLNLAESLHAPIITRLDAKGVVDETHPLAFGVVGVHGKPGLEAATSLIASADMVICIGVDDETLLACDNTGLQIRKIIEIEPDAVVVSTRFQAEHTIIGDIKTACDELTKRILEMSDKIVEKRAAMQSNGNGESSNGEETSLSYLCCRGDDVVNFMEVDVHDSNKLWRALHDGQWKELLDLEFRLRYKAHIKDDAKPGYCHPASVLHALSIARSDDKTNSTARDATLCVDVGDVTLWASLCFTLSAGSRTLSSERMGTMGYGLCAGVAAILAKPAPSCAIVVAGDGGFQMTLQELATFMQHKRPGDKLIVVVLDNQALGRVLFGLDDALGCELLGPDYVALARAYGGDGVRLDKDGDAPDVARRALDSDGLFIIHVIVNPALKADMAKFTDNSIQEMKKSYDE